MTKKLKQKGRAIIRNASKEPHSLDAENRLNGLLSIFDWYDSQEYKTDTHAKFVNEYSKRHNLKYNVKNVPDSFIPKRPWSYLCRMDENGIELTNEEHAKIQDRISTLHKKFSKNVVEKKPVLSVAEKVKRIAQEKYLGEVDYFIDCLTLKKNPPNLKKYVEDCKIEYVYVREIIKLLQKYLEEYQYALNPRDEQDVEAYSHHTRREWQHKIKKIEEAIKSFDETVQKAKAERKPRKKKKISPAKMVSKMKFCKEFNGIKGIEPEKIVGASNVVIFQIDNNKLTVLKSTSEFIVKGSTILNVDEKESYYFKVRQNQMDSLKELAGSKVRRMTEILKSMKGTRNSEPSGRVNEKIIILTVN